MPNDVVSAAPPVNKDDDRLIFANRLALMRILLLAVVGIAGFLITSVRLHSFGFPLDDAWIHQTYARNLALLGEWSFIPGQPSGGSTAPLWSTLLAAGYVLRIPYLLWTFGLGSLSLIGMALIGQALFRAYRGGEQSSIPWAGLFLVGEWHLVWAALSGMETLLFALLILLVLWQVSRARGRLWLRIGLLIGLITWVRPDGITLLGPAGLTLLLVEPDWRARIKALGWLAAGVLALFIPYLLFNLQIQGSIWPNTFYAKQAEYAIQRELPLLVRFFNELKLPLLGSGLFLLPGFVAFIWKACRTRQWAAVSAVIWFLGYALLYALRLPVTYQYGRYFMPAMPVYFISALVGMVGLVQSMRAAGRLSWLLARVWVMTTAVLWISFYIIGTGRYAQDVAIIETEMVTTAHWVAENTPPGALIAAHDIGAMGYFGNRRLLDLAGLISPEVIPFIRDEPQIVRWLDERQADYLIVFPDWYKHLPDGKAVLYQTSARYTIEAGGTNLTVYRWRP